MPKFWKFLRLSIVFAPIATIATLSVLPMQPWGHQALMLFALIWFDVFILFDVLGK